MTYYIIPDWLEIYPYPFHTLLLLLQSHRRVYLRHPVSRIPSTQHRKHNNNRNWNNRNTNISNRSKKCNSRIKLCNSNKRRWHSYNMGNKQLCTIFKWNNYKQFITSHIKILTRKRPNRQNNKCISRRRNNSSSKRRWKSMDNREK